MHRIISLFLGALLLTNVVCRPTQAEDHGHSSTTKIGAAEQKEHLSTIPIGEPVRIKMKDGTEVHGRLSARGDDAFEIETPKPVTISYQDVKSVKRTSVAPIMSNSAIGKRARKFLIIGGFVAVLLVITVVELGKS